MCPAESSDNNSSTPLGLRIPGVLQAARPTAGAPRYHHAGHIRAVYRASKAVQGAMGPGVTYAKFGELLQGFSTEIAIAKDR
jgi:hypothetical protein